MLVGLDLVVGHNRVVSVLDFYKLIILNSLAAAFVEYRSVDILRRCLVVVGFDVFKFFLFFLVN